MTRARAAVLLLLSAPLACRRVPDVYPADVVQNFMTTCTTRSAARVCRCAIDAVQHRFTLEEFRGLEARLVAGEVPKEIVDAVEACRP